MLPSGSAAFLLELESLEEVLARYAALRADPPAGVAELVPAARTILVLLEPGAEVGAVAERVRRAAPRPDLVAGSGTPVEIPVVYDGEDLAEVAGALGCTPDALVDAHTAERWTVAFCGFAPGFGYLVGSTRHWDVPRRPTPRTRVPTGSVALAGEFSGVYPRTSPGGWQLIGRTQRAVFDLDADPPALLGPGARVRFVDAGRTGT